MPRSSKYTVPDEEFIVAVKSSFSIAEVLRKIGLSPYGAAYRGFRIRVKSLQLDLSHFTGQGHLKGKTHNWSPKIPLDELLVENSGKVLHTHVKRRIIKAGLLEEKCAKCGLLNEWQGVALSLHLDHINGDPFDHRIENLRMLCPNCHSQTDTFCSKNRNGRSRRKIGVRERVLVDLTCPVCGTNNRQSSRAKSCEECYNTRRRELQSPYERKTKISWPPLDQLLQELEVSNYWQLGKKLGVSDNAIRKHIQYEKKKLKANS